MAVMFGGANEGLLTFVGDVDMLDSLSTCVTTQSSSRREVN